MMTRTNTKTQTSTIITAARPTTTPTMNCDDTALVVVVEAIVGVESVVGSIGVATGVSEDGVWSASGVELLVEKTAETVLVMGSDDVPEEGSGRGPEDIHEDNNSLHTLFFVCAVSRVYVYTLWTY